MRFLKELIVWFCHGTFASDSTDGREATTSVSEPAHPVTPEKREITPKNILDDLNSIEPISKRFDKAKEDLIEELRRLAPPKRRRSKV